MAIASNRKIATVFSFGFYFISDVDGTVFWKTIVYR